MSQASQLTVHFYLLPDTCSEEIFVELKDEVHAGSFSYAGKFTKQSTGGKPYWTSTGGENAIWFHDMLWRIGTFGNKGTYSNDMWTVQNSMACPEKDGNKWVWNNGNGFHNANENAKVVSYSGNYIGMVLAGFAVSAKIKL